MLLSLFMTVKNEEKYGAQIYFYKWDNSFANARNYSLSKVTKDWILIMDADDEIRSKDKDKDKDKVIKLINDKNTQLNAYFGEALSYSGDVEDYNIYSNLNIQLVKNNKGYKFIGDIHEQIIPGSEVTRASSGFIENYYASYQYDNSLNNSPLSIDKPYNIAIIPQIQPLLPIDSCYIFHKVALSLSYH